MMNKPYPKYKPSGVEWLGDVPEHWEVKKLKHIASRITKGTTPSTLGKEFTDEGILFLKVESISDKMSIIDEMCVHIDSETHQLLSRSRLRENDVVLSIAGAIGRTAIIRKENLPANTNQALSIISPKLHRASPKWICYSANGKYFTTSLSIDTVKTAQENVSLDTISNSVILLPPLPEQQAIAAFLDRETGRIDALIAKKERLLELLAEQRSALISRAVTKGLDASVKLKPSGVEWLGDVPEHWEVKKLKHTAFLFGRIGFRGYTTDDLVDEGEGAITLSPSNMKDGEIDLTKSTYISWEKYYESPEIMLKPEDVVIVKTGSTFGKIAYVRKVDHPITLNPQLAVFKNLKCSSRFFFYYVGAPYIQDQISLSNTGSTIPTMTQQTIMSYAIHLPPLPEQQVIAAFLDRETAKIDTLSAKVFTVIERLKEYRTALISSAVTGKIDVREAGLEYKEKESV